MYHPDETIKLWIKVQRCGSEFPPISYSHFDKTSQIEILEIWLKHRTWLELSIYIIAPKEIVPISSPELCHYPASLSPEVCLHFHFLGIESYPTLFN